MISSIALMVLSTSSSCLGTVFRFPPSSGRFSNNEKTLRKSETTQSMQKINQSEEFKFTSVTTYRRIQRCCLVPARAPPPC